MSIFFPNTPEAIDRRENRIYLPLALTTTAFLAIGMVSYLNSNEAPYPEFLASSTQIPGNADPCIAANTLADETGTDINMQSCIEAAASTIDNDKPYLRVELETDGEVRVIPLG